MQDKAAAGSTRRRQRLLRGYTITDRALLIDKRKGATRKERAWGFLKKGETKSSSTGLMIKWDVHHDTHAHVRWLNVEWVPPFWHVSNFVQPWITRCPVKICRSWMKKWEREREKKKHLIIWIGPAGVGGRASSKLELHTEKRRKTTASDPNQRTTRFVGWWSPYCLITLDEGHSLSSPRPPYGRWQTSQYVVYVDLFFLFLFLSCNTPTHLFSLSPPSFFVTSARINEKKKKKKLLVIFPGMEIQSICNFHVWHNK